MAEIARPYIAAGAALVTAAGLVAAAPALTAPALPDVQVPAVQVPAVQLTGFADSLESALQGFNGFVLNGLVDVNSGLVSGQVGLEELIFGNDSALNGVVNRLFNVGNMGFGTVQNFLNGAIGIRPDAVGADTGPGHLTWNLLTGQNAFGVATPNVFNSGEIGGLEGMAVQGLQALGNVIGIPTDSMSEALNNALIALNGFLVDGVLNFNHFLTSAELFIEEHLIAPFVTWLTGDAPDSLFNGALNRGFDAFNMLIDAGQQSLLGGLGANFDPVDLTLSLLTTGPDFGVGQVLSDGTIGGLEGFFAQAYMAFADFIGMFTGP